MSELPRTRAWLTERLLYIGADAYRLRERGLSVEEIALIHAVSTDYIYRALRRIGE